jgi:hypothetical protein
MKNVQWKQSLVPVSPEPALIALLQEFHVILIPWTQVRICTIRRDPFPFHRVEPGRA